MNTNKEMPIRKTVSLYLSSADRVSGTIDDFSVRVPSIIPNVVKIEVAEVILPLVLYNITDTTNVFSFTDSLSAPLTVTLEPGSYSAATFMTALELLMNAATTDVFTITYSSQSFSFTIHNATGGWDINADDNTVYSKMGIEFVQIETAVAVGASWDVIGNTVAFGIPFHAYIESTALTIRNSTHSAHYMSSNSSENGRNIIAKIPMTDNTGGVVFTFYQNKESSTSIISETGTHSLTQRIDLRLKFPSEQEMKVLTDWSVLIHVHHY
jgi:hypothetical protein